MAWPSLILRISIFWTCSFIPSASAIRKFWSNFFIFIFSFFFFSFFFYKVWISSETISVSFVDRACESLPGCNGISLRSNCNTLHDLGPFVLCKERERHPWRKVTFSKVTGWSLKHSSMGVFHVFLNYTNGTKSRKHSSPVDYHAARKFRFSFFFFFFFSGVTLQRAKNVFQHIQTSWFVFEQIYWFL